MSAQSFQVVTYRFSDPDWSSFNTEATSLNGTVAFTFMISTAISTLSTNDANPGQDVTGLLYVPDLASTDPCVHASAPYVPANVTRQANLPNKPYDLVAIAPWISPACTLNYLQSAQQDPIQGFIFFTPDNNTNTPPQADDPQWNLGDGGAWKSKNRFPVYAIPGPSGRLLMSESAYYSGNVTQVPNGNLLVQSGDPRDYIRLYMDIGIGAPSTLPSLWVFLLIILGILVAVIVGTSFVMHYVQRRRRESLRRRVASGEVDLEALGIQRLTVPRDLLHRMPLYEYASETPAAKENSDEGRTQSFGETDYISEKRPSSSLSPLPVAGTPHAQRDHPMLQSHLHQPTCAICLDDYQVASDDSPGTVVRQLPCQHIFHPECVDTFLRDNSSLCPMCKKSALPQGYCPRVITNVMVRRERIVRRLRERAVVPGDDGDGTHVTSWRQPPTFLASLERWRPALGRRTNADLSSTTGQSMTDLSTTRSPDPEAASCAHPTVVSSAALPVHPPANPASRREWSRQRALAMLGRRPAPLEPEVEERRPRWRKVLGGVWPGIT